MRKIAFLTILLFITASAIAASNVVITVTDDDIDSVTISFASDANLIRAFGLNIEVTDANIISVEVLDPNYRIFPRQIEIDGGEITAYNTPYDPCDLGDANLTIGMASLYTMDANYIDDPNAGYGMQPELAGNLLKFYVDSAPSTYTVTENTITGGVVMEDPCEPANVSIVLADGGCIGCSPPKCMAETNPSYADWIAFGEPNCWCYERQCRGDADGKKTIIFWVYSPDLGLLKSCYGKSTLPPGGICADFDHNKTIIFRVYSPDLAILKSYYGKSTVPPCDMNNPDPPYEPYYNFWVVP